MVPFQHLRNEEMSQEVKVILSGFIAQHIRK
jgi:hypothetical protein